MELQKTQYTNIYGEVGPLPTSRKRFLLFHLNSSDTRTRTLTAMVTSTARALCAAFMIQGVSLPVARAFCAVGPRAGRAGAAQPVLRNQRQALSRYCTAVHIELSREASCGVY